MELTSRASGVPLEEVLAEAKAARPLMMREDLPGALPMADAPLTPLPDPAPLTPLPDLDGPVGPAAQAAREAAVEYDVHLMAYPIGGTFNLFGAEVPKLASSHAFVIVTERGMGMEDMYLAPNVPNDGNIPVAARGGPDIAARRTVFLPDSALPDGPQHPTDKTENGNVYAEDIELSIDDLRKPGVYHTETLPTTHDLEAIKKLIGAHREMINRADIDYEVFNRNSNTYAGDVYEMLTGADDDRGVFVRDGHLRTLPAFGKDLMDYSGTAFEKHFGTDFEADTPARSVPAPAQETSLSREQEHGREGYGDDDYGYDL